MPLQLPHNLSSVGANNVRRQAQPSQSKSTRFATRSRLHPSPCRRRSPPTHPRRAIALASAPLCAVSSWTTITQPTPTSSTRNHRKTAPASRNCRRLHPARLVRVSLDHPAPLAIPHVIISIHCFVLNSSVNFLFYFFLQLRHRLVEYA